jgi:hypothetical protein
VIHFNGLDSIKEFNYLTAAEDWSRRGLACLFVDQPGTGALCASTDCRPKSHLNGPQRRVSTISRSAATLIHRRSESAA